MKLHPVNLIIAILFSAVAAYGLWSIDGVLKDYIAIGSFAYFVATLAPAIALLIDSGRRAVNFRLVCTVFFVLGLLGNLIFSYVPSSVTFYLVSNLIVFILYVFLANSIFSSRQ